MIVPAPPPAASLLTISHRDAGVDAKAFSVTAPQARDPPCAPASANAPEGKGNLGRGSKSGAVAGELQITFLAEIEVEDGSAALTMSREWWEQLARLRKSKVSVRPE